MDEGRRKRLHAKWAEIGEDAIRADMANGGFRHVGGPPEIRQEAQRWLNELSSARQAKTNAEAESDRWWQRAGVVAGVASALIALFPVVAPGAIGFALGFLVRGWFP
jgi:hypothetical protein